nr:alpha/beta hydrolase [Halobacillus locisalis]
MFFSASKPTRSEYGTDVIPTVFVHGYKGGERSFSTMLHRFEQKNWGERQMLIRVSRNGKVNINGHVAGPKPMVQVIFENSRASLEQQTKWLRKVMKTLHSDFSVESVNLVSHSMGGLASANYLVSNDTKQPQVRNLAVIASPFKGIDKAGYFQINQDAAADDLQPQSDALQQLTSKEIPHDIDVLSISGVINEEDSKAEHWDGLVHVTSSQAIKKMVSRGQLEKEIVYGPLATHSGLHELPQVDQLVHDFLVQ